MAAPDRFSVAQDHVYAPLSREQDKEWRGPFTFVQFADTQLGMLNPVRHAFDRTLPLEKRDWKREVEMLEAAVAHVNRLKPLFVIVCGDLVNAFPYGDDKELQELQVLDFKRCMGAIDPAVHVLCVCGNHDIGDRPTPAAIALFRQRFGDDCFSFWAGGVRCLVLNTQLHKDGAAAPAEVARQAAWLQAEAQRCPPPYTLVFSHVPPFIEAPDEPDGYFNLAPAVRAPLLQTLACAGARAWFCGHYHRNAGGMAGDLEVVVSSAVGTTLQPSGTDPLGLQGFQDPDCGPHTSGLRIVKVQREGVVHRFFTMAHVPAAVDPASREW